MPTKINTIKKRAIERKRKERELEKKNAPNILKERRRRNV